MADNLPYGAAEILALRKAGKRPADMILVSLVGPLPGEVNPVVVAQPTRSYDWRFIFDLPVMIVATTETQRLASTVKALEGESPRSLSVWYADKQGGSNILVDGDRPNTKSGRRIGVEQRVALAGLGSTESASDCLKQIACQVKRWAMENADHFDAALVDMAMAGFKRLFGPAWEAVS